MTNQPIQPVEKDYGDICDEVAPAVEILQTLADLACSGHGKHVEVNANALATTLDVVISMINHALHSSNPSQ